MAGFETDRMKMGRSRLDTANTNRELGEDCVRQNGFFRKIEDGVPRCFANAMADTFCPNQEGLVTVKCVAAKPGDPIENRFHGCKLERKV